MANKTVTVRPSGGDYTSLAAAISGEVTANANLVTNEMILTISIEGDWSGGAETGYVNVDGFTASADYYLNIICDEDNRAGTSIDATKYRIEAGSNPGTIIVRQSYARITGVQVRDTTGGGQSAILITSGATNVIIDSCLSYTNGWDAFCFQGDNGGNNIFRNCIAIGCSQRGYHNRGQTNYVYNCVAIRCSNGITAASGSTLYSINNFSGNNSSNDYEAVGTLTLTDSYSEDGTASTPTIVYSTDNFTNVTNGSEDLSLPSGSALIDEGTDLSSDATFPFDWDITGATRSGTWDVGAYEYSAGGGGETSIPVIMHHYAMMRK